MIRIPMLRSKHKLIKRKEPTYGKSQLLGGEGYILMTAK